MCVCVGRLASVHERLWRHEPTTTAPAGSLLAARSTHCASARRWRTGGSSVVSLHARGAGIDTPRSRRRPEVRRLVTQASTTHAHAMTHRTVVRRCQLLRHAGELPLLVRQAHLPVNARPQRAICGRHSGAGVAWEHVLPTGKHGLDQPEHSILRAWQQDVTTTTRVPPRCARRGAIPGAHTPASWCRSTCGHRPTPCTHAVGRQHTTPSQTVRGGGGHPARRRRRSQGAQAPETAHTSTPAKPKDGD